MFVVLTSTGLPTNLPRSLLGVLSFVLIFSIPSLRPVLSSFCPSFNVVRPSPKVTEPFSSCLVPDAKAGILEPS